MFSLVIDELSDYYMQLLSLQSPGSNANKLFVPAAHALIPISSSQTEDFNFMLSKI